MHRNQTQHRPDFSPLTGHATFLLVPSTYSKSIFSQASNFPNSQPPNDFREQPAGTLEYLRNTLANRMLGNRWVVIAYRFTIQA